MPKLSAVLNRMVRLSAFAVLAVALLAGPPADAVPLVTLEGTLHERDVFPGLLLDDSAGTFLPAQLPSGRFSFYADTDLRTDPQAAVLETDAGGWLFAMAPESLRLLTPPRRDPESGRTLRPDAPDGAVCPAGDEPDCWRPGDPPLAVEDVVDALCAAIGSDVSTCRFREHLGAAPVSAVTFPGDAVPPPTHEPTSGPFVPLNPHAGAMVQSGALLQSFPGFPGAFASGSLSSGPVEPLNGDLDNEQLVVPSAFPVSAGQNFASETAAASFNFLMVLVANSGGPGALDETEDPLLPAEKNEFDPSDAFSTTTGKCSFLQAQFCSAVQTFFSLFSSQDARLLALPDDPFGTPHERWIWEAGAELEITAAGGGLGRFAGGRLFALGLERSRVAGPATDVGVTFLLVSDDPAETPQLFFAAPEPEGSALAGAALATLAAVSRRRRARS